MARPSQIDPRERKLVQLLKAERVKQGISTVALAAKVGIARTTITHLELDNNRPTLWVLLKLADGLGVNLADYLRKASK